MYDYYKILDIPRDATLDDIKRAYRLRAKMVHPDVNTSPKANEIFLVVNEAYEVLSDDNRRYLHDLKLNYAEATKAEAERKKHYYGSSSRNDTYTNTNNFNSEWENFSRQVQKEKNDEDYYRQNPVVYNLFFASGMLIGFVIIIVSITGTVNNFWPWPFGAISIAGVILVREGWKGIMGKKSMMANFISWFRK